MIVLFGPFREIIMPPLHMFWPAVALTLACQFAISSSRPVEGESAPLRESTAFPDGSLARFALRTLPFVICPAIPTTTWASVALLSPGLNSLEDRKRDVSSDKGPIVRFPALKGESIQPIGFFPGGKILVLRTDSAMWLGDVGTGKVKEFLRYPAAGRGISKVRNGTLSPDGKTLVTNGFELIDGYGKNIFTYWDVSTGTKLKSFEHMREAYGFLSYTLDGKYLAWDHKTPCICIRSNTAAEDTRILQSGRAIHSIALSPDSALLASSYARTEGYEISLWDFKATRFVTTLTSEKGGAADGLSFSPDSKSLVVGGWATLDFWDLRKGAIQRRLRQPGAVVSWLSNGHAIILRGTRQTGKKLTPTLRLLEVLTGDEICEFDLPGNAAQTFVTAREGHLLAIGNGEEVTVWDLLCPPGLAVEKDLKEILPKTLERLWKDLESNRASIGFQSLLQLAQGGEQVERFLDRRLSPAPALNEHEVAQLINDLDAPNFATREQASKALQSMGRMVYDYLQRAMLAGPSPEREQRLKVLLNRLKQPNLLPNELQQIRAVHVLSRLKSPAARKLLQRLASGGRWSHQTIAAQDAMDRLNKP